MRRKNEDRMRHLEDEVRRFSKAIMQMNCEHEYTRLTARSTGAHVKECIFCEKIIAVLDRKQYLIEKKRDLSQELKQVKHNLTTIEEREKCQ